MGHPGPNRMLQKMSTEPNSSLIFNAVYRHGVDEKRRLQIPSKWRPKTEDFQFTILLWPSAAIHHDFLLAMPPQPLDALMEKFKGMRYADAGAESLRRFLSRSSDQVTLDKAGRICLPDGLAKGAGIEKEAVLIGSWDRFEIWSPERYEAVQAIDTTLGPEALKLI
jgi:MraZ protein